MRPQASIDTMESAVISIPQEDVGRIIGKQGAQIKALREQSGCDIIVDTSDKASPVARLKGKASCVATARTLIMNICGGDGMAFLRDIDDGIMAHLNCKNFLQTQQALANVTTELRGRSLKITSLDGDSEAANRFKTMLEEHIMRLSEITSETVTCDVHTAIPLRENPVIRRLEAEQNLKLDFVKEGPRLIIKVNGQRGVVDEALKLIENLRKSTSETTRDSVQLIPRLFANCSQQKVDDFQADLEEGIAQRFGVQVKFVPDSTHVLLEGSEEQVAAAKEETEQLLQYYFNDNCASIYLPPFAVTDICGRQNENLLNMQRSDLCLSVDVKYGRIWICGTPNRAAVVYHRLVVDIAEWEKRNILLPIKEERVVGFLKGAGSDVLRRIQETTRAQVSVESDIPGVDTPHCIWICGGTSDAVQAAKLEVEQLLRSCRDQPTRTTASTFHQETQKRISART